jgi:hypothetical protein
LASLGMASKGVFSEGRTLCVRVERPRECQDIAFPPGAFTIAPQSKRGMLGLARCFPCWRAEPAPPRGGPSEGKMALRGSPGITREVVFSEGRGLRARTARHHGWRKVSSMGEDRRQAGCPTGTCLDQARAFLAGVRSPPLRGVDYPRARRPCGASPGITREGVFSEGRGLRAHTARHHGLRKVSSMGEDRREAGCPREICLRQAGALFAGVRSPPLRGVDHPRARRPCGASPGITREGVFSEGRTLCVRLAWPNVCRGIPFPPAWAGEKPVAQGGYASVKPVPSYPGVRSPPLRGEAKRR